MKQLRTVVVTMCALLLLMSAQNLFAQKGTDAEKEAAYTRTINDRAAKIVLNLGITDTAKATRVRNIIANQYRALNDIHTYRNDKVKSLKASGIAKESVDAQVTSLEADADDKLTKLHATYLAALSSELNADQVDKVKDGMTYDVVHVTYKGYQAMIPTLTEKQKEQILTWLVEAREHAMDAESSDKKHAWFGKYKGRINNYLSAAGYDLRKEGEEWEKRRNAEKQGKTAGN